jgi:hypothetical protein
MITIKTRFGKTEYEDNEQIYPWGYLAPGNYQEIPGCCGGCQASIERGGPLLDGHMGCSGAAFDSGPKELDCQLQDGDWVALVEA